MVALFTRDPAVMEQWSAILSGECELHPVVELIDLDDLLRAEPIQVVVTEWIECVVEAIERSGRAIRILHQGPSVPDGLLEAFARGFEVAHLDHPGALAERVRELSRAARSLSIRQSLNGFEVTCSAGDAAYALIDISTDGFAFRVESGDVLDPVLPGCVLEDVRIARRGVQVVTGTNAVVRNVTIVHGKEPYYRVGCAFRAARPAVARAVAAVIKDRAVIAGLMRNALVGGEGITVHRLHDPDERVQCSRGRIDVFANQLTIEHNEAGLESHEVVRGTFETGGNLYSFVTAVKSGAPLCLQLPVQLDETQKRLSPRYRPDASRPLMAELHSMLFSVPRLRIIRDLSTSGFSVDVDPAVDAFPPGLRLDHVKIRIGQHEIACCGRVRNVARLSGKQRTIRCGIEFEDMADDARVRLTTLLMQSRLPGLDAGGNVEFDELWQFFKDTGFVYPEKEQALAPVMTDVRRMFDSLHARTTKDFNAVLMRDEGKIVGHVSGLRIYRKTWMFQHLAALSGHNAGPLLNLGALECFAQDSGLEYFRLWFLPESRWPNRVFGGIARKISNRELSELRSCYPIHIATDERFESPVDGFDVFEAAESDLNVVERYFVEHETLMLRAEDLTASALSLREVNNAYKKLGLQRRRRVLIATYKDVPVGFALVEISSPGLNLSEALSAFRIFLLPSTGVDTDAVRRSLLGALLRTYRQAGRKVAVGTVHPDEVEAYQRMGIKVGPHWMCWTAHRSLYRRFYDHVERTFEVLRQRASRPKRAAND